MQNRAQLLKTLYLTQGKFISGEKLSHRLGVSRTTIWKYIRYLREQGYRIESRTNQGYRLQSTPDLLIPEELSWRLTSDSFGREIIYRAEIDSTNRLARELADSYDEGTIVVAEKQRAGRGRRNRDWYSPAGTGIWCSIILQPVFRPEKAPLLTIIASLAVSRALEAKGLNPKIKWPNDVLLNGKKICGVLSELNADLEGIKYAIVGIGVNVNQSEFPEHLEDKAGSIYLITGKTLKRACLLVEVLDLLEDYYTQLTNDPRTDLLEQWKSRLTMINKRITINSQGRIYRGIARDVSERGELILETESGERRSFWAGDTSLV